MQEVYTASFASKYIITVRKAKKFLKLNLINQKHTTLKHYYGIHTRKTRTIIKSYFS